MPRTQRVVQYIQRLAYESLYQPEERDERPEDVLTPAPSAEPSYTAWNATSFAAYVPFRGPTSS